MLFTTVRLERPEGTILLRGIPVQLKQADPTDLTHLHPHLDLDGAGLCSCSSPSFSACSAISAVHLKGPPAMPLHPAIALPAQPATFAALQAMQTIVLMACLVGGVTPFAALSPTDAARFGVANAVFIDRPNDFKDAYLPQCCIWIPPESESVALAGFAGRAIAEFEVRVQIFADLRGDWYAAEQQFLAICDTLWPALLRHNRLGGALPTALERARPAPAAASATSTSPAASTAAMTPAGGSVSTSPSLRAAPCSRVLTFRAVGGEPTLALFELLELPAHCLGPAVPHGSLPHQDYLPPCAI